MPLKFDLICLGTGPASTTVATACSKQGLKVAMIESREFGGTCALRGCNPKKVFTNAAALLDQFQRATGHLVRGSNTRIEWTDLVTFQHEFTNPVREKTEGKLQKRGIETIHGVAKFETETVIRVGEKSLEAANIFVGVGARPVPLKIPGEDLVVTSDDFMELRSLPSEIIFLGGGYISFEFAGVTARAGATVQIVDRNDMPLKQFDPDLVRLLMKASDATGIRILTNTEATSIERSGSRLKVTLETAQGIESPTTDLVVHGGGRVPDLDVLNLEAGQVRYGKHGITVNEFLQSTTNPAVYAAGDCADTGVPMLTPTANQAARVAATNIIANHRSTSLKETTTYSTEQAKQKVDYGCVPQVVFSVPPLAAVGLSEADACDQGLNVDIRFKDLSTKGEVRKLCAPAAACKIIIDRHTDQILGAHILGPHADEVINLFTVAIQSGLTASSLKSTPFTFPTMASEYLRVV